MLTSAYRERAFIDGTWIATAETVPVHNPSTGELLQEGLALHRRGAVNEAAARYHDVLRIDPANADALYYLALISCQHGRFEEGAGLARKSLASDPKQARSHVILGRALHALGLHADALSSFDRAIALANTSAEAAHIRMHLDRLMRDSQPRGTKAEK